MRFEYGYHQVDGFSGIRLFYRTHRVYLSHLSDQPIETEKLANRWSPSFHVRGMCWLAAGCSWLLLFHRDSEVTSIITIIGYNVTSYVLHPH